MRKTLLILFALVVASFAQQVNYTFGQNTAGTYYTETGDVNVDSAATVSIVLDLQDYYPFITDVWGVMDLFLDAENAADSVNYAVTMVPGFIKYHPNDDSRVTVANIEWQENDSTTLVAGARAANDVENSFEITKSGRVLPPEFLKIEIKHLTGVADSIDYQWNIGYPAVREDVQDERRTSRGDSDARKRKETLH